MVSMLVIVFGYMFFFMANSLTKIDDKLYTDISKKIEINNHYFTLESWVYSPDSQKMEIVFYVENKSYDGNDTYECEAVSRKNSNISSDVIINTRDLLVVHLSNVPNHFGEISLRIFYDELTKEQPLRIYTNENDVEITQSIQMRTANVYYIERNKRLIVQYESENLSYENEIQTTSDKISNANTSISDLKAQSVYKTEAELSEIESQIRAIEGEISIYENDIRVYQEKIKENESRIRNCISENEVLSQSK